MSAKSSTYKVTSYFQLDVCHSLESKQHACKLNHEPHELQSTMMQAQQDCKACSQA
jgi:hypothetical protein